MQSDFDIGRVVAVDTAEVTIELSRDLKALTQSTYEGAREIGKINSYVVLPVGARRLVAIITRVILVEEAELKADRTMVTLPSARRLMKATLIGTIDGSTFTQGIATFPVLDNPVQVATKGDLQTIFDVKQDGDTSVPDPQKPGFCIEIGQSAVFEDFPVQIDPDAFFGKHAAILGSTGSGKSCTIASILQSILQTEEVQRTTVVLLDTNGEYQEAFQNQGNGGDRRYLYLPSDSANVTDRIVIPYWFMNADDFVRLFRASQGVQRPVLLESLRLARNEGGSGSSSAILRENLVHEINRIWALSGSDEKTSKDLRDISAGLLNYIPPAADKAWADLAHKYPNVTHDKVETALTAASKVAEMNIGEDSRTKERIYPKVIPADGRSKIRSAIEPIYQELTGTSPGEAISSSGVSADTPAFFDKVRFRTQHVEQVLRREESGGARARDFSGTMLLRIDRLLADRRFEFLLGPVDGSFPRAEHVLAAFIRDILGIPSAVNPMPPLSDESSVVRKTFPFYDRQRAPSQGFNIVILDLSLLAAEVLENVTALIGRLILEFMQRLGEGGEEMRGSLPVVLVLEEAQNYIHEQRFGEDESISRIVFERIAREGRKYGLSLVVSSQRPSELSKTVLSQCSSFIVHRLQNPEDLRYFKEIVPSIYGPLLAQVSALAPQTALVLGECVRAPALVRIREARPTPRSRDPKFYAYWVNPKPKAVPVEEICAKWEGHSE